MIENNWYIIDKFLYNDYLPIVDILNTFLDSEKKRIFFSFYFFNLDDCEEGSDYSKNDCINEEFEYFKQRADASIDYDGLTNKVMDMLCEEYFKIYKKCDEFVRKELYEKFINDEIDLLDESVIYSIKEFIARETLKPNKRVKDFIDQRKVFENNINISFTFNRLYDEEDKRILNYVWYEPKSKEDLTEVVKFSTNSFSCIITEDISNFNNYLYAFECFEQADFLLAINDRVGNFESVILPRIKEFFRKENVIYNEKEYFKVIKKSYTD